MTNRFSGRCAARLLILAWAALCLALSGAAADGGEVSAAADASKPFVVKIHADWCGTCARLAPTFEVLEEKLGSRARIVVLDVTDKQTLARARAEAERLGISGFFDTYKAKTGTVGVLDGASREPVRVMKGELDVAAYEAAIEQASGAGSS